MREQNPHACSDHGCIFRVGDRPWGMGTNGGCHCIPGPGRTMTMGERTQIRKAILWMKAELERLDKAAKETT